MNNANYIDFFEKHVIDKLNLVESKAFSTMGFSIENREGSYFICCPYCSSLVYYEPFTKALFCQHCKRLSIAKLVVEHAKNKFQLHSLSKEVGVDMRQLGNTYPASLSFRRITDFLNAQLSSNFKEGLSAAGWSEHEISNAFLGVVGDDGENIWNAFIGDDYPDECAVWMKFKDYLYMPFYDGERINAVLLPPDFRQEDAWSNIGFRFLLPPSTSFAWAYQAKKLKGNNIIVVSNPVYCVYLLSQNKPCIFVHSQFPISRRINLEVKNYYVFEDDFVSRELLPSNVNIIENSDASHTGVGVWGLLKSTDINRNKNKNWILPVEQLQQQGMSLSDAVGVFESTNNAEVVVRPLE